MKRIVFLLLCCALSAPVFGETVTSRLSIAAYVKAYVATSAEVMNQGDKIADLASALETAKIRKDSSLSIEAKTLELEVARLAVREIENAAALKAVDLYLTYLSASRDLVAAQESYEIALAEYDVIYHRYLAEEESERAVQSRRIALLQSQKSLENARNRVRNALNALTRPLELDDSVEFDIGLSLAEAVNHAVNHAVNQIVMFDASRVQAMSSSYYRTSHTVRLKEQEQNAKAGSSVFTASEIAALDDSLEQAKDDRQAIVWSLEDRLSDATLTLAGTVADLEIARLNLELNQTDLETALLQYEFGELLGTDLAVARSKVRSANSTLESLNETILKTLLSAEDLNGGSVERLLVELLSENP